eukprot:TRINITY_DN17468_c0_g1_i1.p1 TRINITY_DN17468_c0_g1~~TRINITY_DN17468_c0_g1_i1.p1  ORF type:complete len:496 (-),score=112.39 TRINITY_DN17468_c0_g1_i1:194-1681(-)
MSFVTDNTLAFALILFSGLLVIICSLLICVKYVFRRRDGYQDVENGIYNYLKSQPGYQEEEVLDSATVYVNAQMYLRSQMAYSIKKHLNDIGGRKNKNYLVVKTMDGREEKMMIMTPVGSECVFLGAGESIKVPLTQIMTSLKHPYLYPLSDYGFVPENNNSVAFRPISKQGSLKDAIFKASPRDFYHNKYQTPRAVPSHVIPAWGRQILEAMIYLKNAKIPFYHLHAGNVMLENNTCYITDYENTIIGFPLPGYIQEGISGTGHTSEPQAVSFAFLLYEMIAGFPPESGVLSQMTFSQRANPAIVQIIQSILAPKTDLTALRTLEDIVAHPFFSSVRIGAVNTGTPKYDVKSRELLKSVMERTRIQPSSGSKRAQSTSRNRRTSNAPNSTSSTTSAGLSVSPKESGIRRDSQPPAPSSPTGLQPPTKSTSAAAPPPPPPPPPPPAPSAAILNSEPPGGSKDALQQKLDESGLGDARGNLLASIRAGKKLKSAGK